jgi:hypothetical protein
MRQIAQLNGRGFITLACGTAFAEMAIDLALSVKEFQSEPISILVDSAAKKRLIKNNGLSLFDELIEINSTIHPWGMKIVAAQHAPYAENIFIDADVILRRPTGFFDTFTVGAVAMYGAYMTPEDDFLTYYHSSEIFREFEISRYFWATSGIFQFRRPDADSFFNSCATFYQHGIKRHPQFISDSLPDELVFGIQSDRFPIDAIKCETLHPWPMANTFHEVHWSDLTWPTVHVFGKLNDDFMADFLKTICSRRQRFKIPETSAQHWMAKSRPNPGLWRKITHRLRRLFLANPNRTQSVGNSAPRAKRNG